MYPRPEDNATVVAALIPQGATRFPVPTIYANEIAETAINNVSPYTDKRILASRKPPARVTPIRDTSLAVAKEHLMIYFP